jgi:hypothetical protein
MILIQPRRTMPYRDQRGYKKDGFHLRTSYAQHETASFNTPSSLNCCKIAISLIEVCLRPQGLGSNASRTTPWRRAQETKD